MFWSYSIQTGVICNCENEDEAVGTANDYPNDIVFEADLIPPMGDVIDQVIRMSALSEDDLAGIARIMATGLIHE